VSLWQKNIATKTPNHKDFTKKNKRNALSQKSKTTSWQFADTLRYRDSFDFQISMRFTFEI
jgi:hypothetical protein